MKTQLINVVVVALFFAGTVGNVWSAEQATKKQHVKATTKAVLKPFAGVDAITGMEFVLVKGGCFQMGDSLVRGREDERPAHQVCVPDFYLGKYEVTQAQWQKIMGKDISYNKECGKDCPVDSVGWDDAQKFIMELNSQSGRKFRLPTEAEWEYAARSGGKDDVWSGTSDAAMLGEFAWYSANAEGKTHPVGKKKPNSLGLYDMSGNVWEWCQDFYGEGYYRENVKDNPAGPSQGEKRSARGGVFDDDEDRVRSVARNKDIPGSGGGSGSGFRLLHPVK